jgi:hypothetical protein
MVFFRPLISSLGPEIAEKIVETASSTTESAIAEAAVRAGWTLGNTTAVATNLNVITTGIPMAGQLGVICLSAWDGSKALRSFVFSVNPASKCLYGISVGCHLSSITCYTGALICSFVFPPAGLAFTGIGTTCRLAGNALRRTGKTIDPADAVVDTAVDAVQDMVVTAVTSGV